MDAHCTSYFKQRTKTPSEPYRHISFSRRRECSTNLQHIIARGDITKSRNQAVGGVQAVEGRLMDYNRHTSKSSNPLGFPLLWYPAFHVTTIVDNHDNCNLAHSLSSIRSTCSCAHAPLGFSFLSCCHELLRKRV